MIYLDYNATTPVDPAVCDAMQPYLREHHGNPSSGHALGRNIRAAIDRARDQVASLIGSSSGEIVFTSGGTEANNHAIKGSAWSAGRGHIVISAVEHPAAVAPAQWLCTASGMEFELTVVEVDAAGCVDPKRVAAAIRSDTVLVSIMLANNEVGTIQPIREIAAIARAAGVLMHTDAAQVVGKIPVRVDDLGVDLLTIAGHKLYAPSGVGALFVRDGVKLESLLHGAGHEAGRRSGTEAAAAIIGLGAAAELASRDLAMDRIAALRDRLYEGLAAELGDRVVRNGHKERCLPNTLNLGFVGLIAADVIGAMPEICVSAGAACHAGRAKASAVLTAMGVPDEVAFGAVRFSLGRYTTEQEVDTAIEQVSAGVRSLIDS